MGDVATRETNGRFQAGHQYGGRRVGSRQRLSKDFWDDLYMEWKLEGRKALHRLARNEPAVFAKIVAMSVLKPNDEQVANNAVTVVNVITGVREK
jgi:hypothetical protein